MKKLILLLLVWAGAASAQCGLPWADFSTLTAASNLSGSLNGKLNFQCGAGAPTTQSGTVGKDAYIDTVGVNLYLVSVSGSPATWKMVGFPGTVSGSNIKLPGTLTVGTTFSSLGLPVNIVAEGADPTGVASSTAAIAAAIANAPVGGTVLIPVGNFLLTGSGSELIKITQAVHLVCDSWQGTQLIVSSAVPGTTDVVHVVGPVVGFTIENCNIVPQSGTPARNAINLDATAGVLSNFVINHNYLGAFGGKGIVTTFPTGTNGIFSGMVRDNYIQNAIDLVRSGDSMRIMYNTLTGAGPGIEVNTVPGATTNIIEGNSIVSCSGGIVLHSAENPQILNNIVEPAVGCAIGTNSALIDVQGDVNVVKAPRVVGNQLTPLTGGPLYGVRFDNVVGGFIDHNRFYVSTSGQVAGDLTANAVNTLFGVQSLDNAGYAPTSANLLNNLSSSAATTPVLQGGGQLGTIGQAILRPTSRVDFTGTAGVETVLMTVPIPVGTATSGTSVRIHAAGTITGTAAGKQLILRYGTATLTGTVINQITFAASPANNWIIDGEVNFLTPASQQSNSTAWNASTPTMIVNTSTFLNNATTAMLVELNGILTSAADTLTVREMRVELIQ